MWWPLVGYLAVGLVTRLVLAAGTSTAQVATLPAGVLTASGVLAVVGLWLLGARRALQLGPGRTRVFWVTLALSVGAQFGYHLVSNLANQIELAAVGWQATRVFAIETVLLIDGEPVGKFGSYQGVFNGTWFLLVAYLLPIVGAVVLVCCAVLRWGVQGAVAGVAAAAALFVLGLLAFAALDAALVAARARLSTAMTVLVGLIAQLPSYLIAYLVFPKRSGTVPSE